jgi:hypothetical protein
MAEGTPKFLASYEAAHTTEQWPCPATIYRLAAQLGIVALLGRGIKRCP